MGKTLLQKPIIEPAFPRISSPKQEKQEEPEPSLAALEAALKPYLEHVREDLLSPREQTVALLIEEAKKR